MKKVGVNRHNNEVSGINRHNGEIFSNRKKGIMVFARKWLELEIIDLGQHESESER